MNYSISDKIHFEYLDQFIFCVFDKEKSLMSGCILETFNSPAV